ncbi:unnamed protein product, partial [Scytosiphon promiscuus]
AVIEQLGEHSDWTPSEQRESPAASPLVRVYLSNAKEEQRRGRVSVKQLPPQVEIQVQRLVWDLHRCVATLPTAAKRFAMVLDVEILCVTFHTMKRGFELSVAVVTQMLQMTGGEGVSFYFLFGKTLRKASQAVVVNVNEDCRDICSVAAMIKYRHAAASMQWELVAGLGFLFPSVSESGDRGNVAYTPVQMILDPQTHLRVAEMEDMRNTMHSFQVGWAASHHMGGTAVDVLMGYVE